MAFWTQRFSEYDIFETDIIRIVPVFDVVKRDCLKEPDVNNGLSGCTGAI